MWKNEIAETDKSQQKSAPGNGSTKKVIRKASDKKLVLFYERITKFVMKFLLYEENNFKNLVVNLCFAHF